MSPTNLDKSWVWDMHRKLALLTSAAGAGKTLISVMLAKHFAEEQSSQGGSKVMFFLAPKAELVKQVRLSSGFYSVQKSHLPAQDVVCILALLAFQILAHIWIDGLIRKSDSIHCCCLNTENKI